MEPIVSLELFAGVGAQMAALTRLGIPIRKRYVCEIDEQAYRSYCAIHGDTPNLGDIIKVEHLPTVDLVTWSYPCTSVSIAGKQEGMAEGSGTASSLGWEVIRLLKDAKERGCLPNDLVMENVPAHLQKRNIPEFERMCTELEKLGYTNSYAVMNAKDYGVPQSRKRVFMVSSLHKGRFIFPGGFPLTRCVKDIMEDDGDVDKTCYLSPERIKHFEEHRIRQEENGRNFGWKPVDPNGVMNAVTTNPDRHSSGNFLILAGNIRDWNYEKAGRVYSPEGCSPTVETPSGGGRMPKFIVQKDPLMARYITPREAWRLMDFTDEQIDRAFGVTASKTQRYKQAGNSIVVACLEHIFKGMYIDGTWEAPRQTVLDDWL